MFDPVQYESNAKTVTDHFDSNLKNDCNAGQVPVFMLIYIPNRNIDFSKHLSPPGLKFLLLILLTADSKTTQILIDAGMNVSIKCRKLSQILEHSEQTFVLLYLQKLP